VHHSRSMIPEPPQCLRQRRVVRGHHATFPVVRCFTGWKLNTVISAMPPTCFPRYSAPNAWQASSISGIPPRLGGRKQRIKIRRVPGIIDCKNRLGP